MQSYRTPPVIDLTWFQQAQGKSLSHPSRTQQSYDIFEHEGLRWVCSADGSVQSMVMLDDPAYPVFGYIKGLLCALLFVQHPENLLNLGLGSGAIERFMLSQLPDVELSSVEPDPDMISLSRECFFLPDSHPVQEDSAQAFLAGNQRPFDIIICDIHPKPGTPNPLLSDSFFQDIATSLTPHGIAAINYLPPNEEEIVRMLLRIRSSLPWVVLFDVPAQQNIVLFCSTSKPADRSVLCSRAGEFRHLSNLEPAAVCEQLIWLPER